MRRLWHFTRRRVVAVRTPTGQHGVMRKPSIVVLALVSAVLAACDGIVDDVAEGEGEAAEGEGEAAEGEGETAEGEGEAAEGEGEVAEGEGEPPPAAPAFVAVPAPGLFAEDAALDVVFHVEHADDRGPLTLWCTTDDSVPVPGVSPSCEPGVAVGGSAGVRAIAVDDAGAEVATFFGAYLRATPEVRALTSTIPAVVLWSPQHAPEFKDEPFVPFTLSVFDLESSSSSSSSSSSPLPLSQTSTLSTRAGIKIRGSSSAGYPKHPWRVETRHVLDDDDDKVPLLGLPSESDWVLNAPLDFDRALLRNSVAFSMSNAIGRYAPRTRHVEVFVVGDSGVVDLAHDEGVYELTELIKRGRNRVNIERLDPDDEDAFDITGGYLWKVDRQGPGESGFFAGAGFNFQQPFVLDDPRESEITPAQQQYLQQTLDDIGNALRAPDFHDPRTGLHYSELLDVDAAIDHHIVNLFTKNPDAFRLSGYFHKDRGGRVVMGPVWDFDRTMGCSSDGRADDPVGFNVPGDATDFLTFGFFEGLFADPAFVDAYVARLDAVLAGPLNVDALDAIVDGHAAAVTGVVAERNFARWSDYPPRGSHADEVAHLKEWLHARHAWLTSCVASGDFRSCR